MQASVIIALIIVVAAMCAGIVAVCGQYSIIAFFVLGMFGVFSFFKYVLNS